MILDLRTYHDALRALAKYLRASGMLEPQICQWKLTAERLARATYACGCWIEWRMPTAPDNCTVHLPFPPPSADRDEFEFASKYLGSLVCERACAKHGGPSIDYAADGYGKDIHALTNGHSWWTEARCLAHGGHRWGGTILQCRRCGTDDVVEHAVKAVGFEAELQAIERAVSEAPMTPYENISVGFEESE